MSEGIPTLLRKHQADLKTHLFPSLMHMLAQPLYQDSLEEWNNYEEEERDIDGVLERCLVREADGADIFTFGGVAIRSLLHKGTVRVRSRPFPSNKFFGRNIQVFD